MARLTLLDPSMRYCPCYYCGSSPTKYGVKIFNEHAKPITILICNMCALTHGERFLDI